MHFEGIVAVRHKLNADGIIEVAGCFAVYRYDFAVTEVFAASDLTRRNLVRDRLGFIQDPTGAVLGLWKPMSK